MFINETHDLWAVKLSYSLNLRNKELFDVSVDLGRVVGWICQPHVDREDLASATPLVRESYHWPMRNFIVADDIRWLTFYPSSTEWRNDRFKDDISQEQHVVVILLVDENRAVAVSMAEDISRNPKKYMSQRDTSLLEGHVEKTPDQEA